MTVRVNAVLNRTVVVDSDVTTSSPYLQTTSDSSVYLRGDLKRLVYVLPDLEIKLVANHTKKTAATFFILAFSLDSDMKPISYNV